MRSGYPHGNAMQRAIAILRHEGLRGSDRGNGMFAGCVLRPAMSAR